MYSNQNGPVVSFETWMAALASSACIGSTSLVPWLFNMTFFERHKQQQEIENEDGRMKFLLSFAVGAILGDIFFHLIPESFQIHLIELNDSKEDAHKNVGLSIIAGIFMFIIVEMILEKWSHSIEEEREARALVNENIVDEYPQATINLDDQIPIFNNKDLKQAIGSLVNYDNLRGTLENNNSLMTDFNTFDTKKTNQDGVLLKKIDLINNNSIPLVNQSLRFLQKEKELVKSMSNCRTLDDNVDTISANRGSILNKNNIHGCRIIDVAGYLSLIANGFDNFTHGLAIGASFLVGPKVGLLTTFVIFIHEIPHEICDYAILVNSGFSRWEAVKAQSSVSLFGILGTATALYVKSLQTLNAKTVWILPFSAGGFLYIALVNLLPEILDRKTNLQNSLGQVACLIAGIAFMAAVAFI